MSNPNERMNDDSPAFLLDVPVLNVDEINLEVSDLRAHISLRAELASFVKINVGVDIYLDEVKLDIKGLEAQALLKVNLERALGTLDRALEAIDKNPQLLSEVTQESDPEVGGAGRDASQSARETEPDDDRTPQQTKGGARYTGDFGRQIDDMSDRTTDGAEQVESESPDQVTNEVDQAVDRSEPTADAPLPKFNQSEGEEVTSNLADLQIEEEYVDERGRIVGRARDGSGNIVEGMLDDEGEVLEALESGESGEAEGRESEDEDNGEVEATDAARRKADELGVRLSSVRGTGYRGRVLVKDVEKAAKAPAEDSG